MGLKPDLFIPRKTWTMSVPAFIDLDTSDQIREIRLYLTSKGAEISDENSEHGFMDDLRQVIGGLDAIVKEPQSESETESVVNSLISLLLVIPPDQGESLIVAFCEKLGKLPATSSNLHLRLLNSLFHGMSERSRLRYFVVCSLYKLAGNTDTLDRVNTSLDQVKTWIAMWDINTQKIQNILRTLHEALLVTKRSEQATKVMIELLSTYTAETASQAREDALRCIVTSLKDPQVLLLDHLTSLTPVTFLEGEPIHELFMIFVNDKLDNYLQFYERDQEFVNSLGLSHEDNKHKMRILTFMQMAENKSEIGYENIQQELSMSADEVEDFIIDVVGTQSVHVKIDQMSKKVVISTTAHRTFGRSQWQQLRDKMEKWQNNLACVQTSLQSVTQ